MGAQFVAGDHGAAKDLLTLYFDPEIAPGGYAWIFPKSDRRANIGLVTVPECGSVPFERLRRFITRVCPTEEVELFESVMNEHMERGRTGALADGPKTIPTASDRPRVIVGANPLGPPIPQLVRGNVALVGDAARLVNPFTGGGLAAALVSGDRLGRLVGEMVEHRHPLARLGEYERFIRRTLYRKLQRQYRLRVKMLADQRGCLRLYRFGKLAAGLIRLFPQSLGNRWLAK